MLHFEFSTLFVLQDIFLWNLTDFFFVLFKCVKKDDLFQSAMSCLFILVLWISPYCFFGHTPLQLSKQYFSIKSADNIILREIEISLHIHFIGYVCTWKYEVQFDLQWIFFTSKNEGINMQNQLCLVNIFNRERAWKEKFVKLNFLWLKSCI